MDFMWFEVISPIGWYYCPKSCRLDKVLNVILRKRTFSGYPFQGTP